MRQTMGMKGASLFLGLLLLLALLLTIASAGCNALLGNDDHGMAAGDAAQVGPASGASSGSTADGGITATADGSTTGRTDGDGAASGATRDSGVGSSGSTDSSAGKDGASDAGLIVVDGSTDAGAGVDGALCDPATPFTSIKMVGGLPSGVEVHGALSPDEMTIWFDTNGGTIYQGTRQSLGAAFATVGLGAGGAPISFTGNDVFPTVSDDLNTLYFLNGNSNLLTEATRADAGLLFVSNGGSLPIASPPGAQYRAPFVTGTTLYYGLYADNFPGSVIYFSDISGNTFSPPQALAGFPLMGAAGEEGVDGERFPVVSRDGNTIYFRAAVFIDSGVGQVGEIYIARRAQSSDNFSAWSVVNELNSDLGEEPLWLSFDQCRLYFTSFRSPAGLYVASH